MWKIKQIYIFSYHSEVEVHLTGSTRIKSRGLNILFIFFLGFISLSKNPNILPLQLWLRAPLLMQNTNIKVVKTYEESFIISLINSDQEQVVILVTVPDLLSNFPPLLTQRIFLWGQIFLSFLLLPDRA